MITSLRNKRVAKAVRLKKRAMREKDRRFLVEGVQSVSEALAAPGLLQEIFSSSSSGERAQAVLDTARASGVPVHDVSPDVMAHLTSTVTPQGVVGVAGFVDVSLAEAGSEGGIVPVLVEVRDPGNAGTVLRSADAAGAEAVVFTSSSVDVYNPKAVRATAGSLFHVPVVREVEPEEAIGALRERGYVVVAATAAGRTSVYDVDLTRPTAVLFGNEARGLPEGTVGLADEAIRVPIHGRAESLNLAAAATVVLFEAARQRVSGEERVLADIVAGAAHDIRSPLTALKGFASTLLSRWDRLDDDQKRMMLEGIVGDSARMDVIVAQLVDAARIGSGHLELSPIPIDLLDVADRVGQGLRPWSSADIHVTGDDGVRALADPARLRLILLALVEGAQWWGETGPVLIHVARGPEPTVSVSREGSTIEPGRVGEVFRPRPPGAGGGSKVGLYVAKGLAEAMGGRLLVEGRDRFGFVLTLPRA